MKEIKDFKFGRRAMDDNDKEKGFFLRVLPVLFMEYLALSLARTLFPELIVNAFGKYSYMCAGGTETIKGLLAFVASPVFGRLSDKIGRKYCILATVVGSTLPVVVMTVTSNMYVYSVVLALSGFFTATFALTFAYISDCVEKKQRASAYGLALATFGLSFCLGPVSGSYIAAEYGSHTVFLLALLLLVLNVVYIILYLPETVKTVNHSEPTLQKLGVAMEYIPNSWNFSETFRIFSADPFLATVAVIVFIYYTSVWAIVSTLMLYITRHLHFSPLALGWLLSCYGLATMFSEAVLVRIIVPRIGEIHAIMLGLFAFSIQCMMVAVSSSPSWIYISLLFSMLANLVYPAVSSLVSKVVPEDQQGEALGALNGIKALTEGFGPLLFGCLMALFEDSPQPGAPYLVASFLSLWAFLHCFELPAEPDLAGIGLSFSSSISSSLKHPRLRRGIEEANGLLSEDCDYSDGGSDDDQR